MAAPASIVATLIVALVAPASPPAPRAATNTPGAPATSAAPAAPASPRATAMLPASPIARPSVPVPGDMSSQSASRAVEGPVPAPATPVAARGVCHGSYPCKRLVAFGTVTGALGLATIFTGAMIAARPVAVDPDDPTMAIAYRPAGTAVLTIGVGVLATSVLMALAAARASRQAARRGPLAPLVLSGAPR